jgi:hypothetical protein
MDALKLFQMFATLTAIAATIAGAGRVVRTSPPGARGPATALVLAMLVAVVVIPFALGIASGTGHALPPRVASAVLVGALVAVTVAGVALRFRYARR